MKARVKATGDIIEIDEDCSYVYAKNYDKSYTLENLEFLDVKENENPDYWTRLEHQYAGMAMQGVLSNQESELDHISDETLPLALARCSAKLAHALVEELKEKEERK